LKYKLFDVILKRNDESVFDRKTIEDFQTRSQLLSQEKDERLANVRKEEKKEPDNPTGLPQ
jgi:hypothetical protein